MNSTVNQKKLGIIAGSGDLPREMIRACRDHQREAFVVAFEGITEKSMLRDVPHALFPLGKIGAIIKRLKQENVRQVVLAGRVGRPSLAALKLDFGGMKLLNRLRKLPEQGDDHVFSAIIRYLEEKGFVVLGADDVLRELLIQPGALGVVQPDAQALVDIDLGKKVVEAIGLLDIGQAAIVQRGVVLGVEGLEGTDKLVNRCAELHQEGVGGVLVKMKKPNQDSRVDLPSIGVYTVENAHRNGLRGIAVEAGGALVIDREAVRRKADELGLFVVGV